MQELEKIVDLRMSYQKSALEREQLDADPIVQFARWLEHALSTDLPEPYAMTLATCGADGRPSARTVLLRGASAEGLLFYTNYDSAKGQDLAENPYAEVLFYWPLLEQQIRVSGRVEKLSVEHSTEYFHSRPKPSQLGAWVSTPQSGVVDQRETLEARYAVLEAQYAADAVIPKPEFWGGYRLIPDQFEFWQGRPNRMHDRFRYQKIDTGWQIDRLMP
jgi:pyridoxamine 5'-phosphate oxidase